MTQSIPDDPDELMAMMRREGLPVEHSFFATIKDDHSNEEMNRIAGDLNDADVARWRQELTAHFASKKHASKD